MRKIAVLLAAFLVCSTVFGQAGKITIEKTGGLKLSLDLSGMKVSGAAGTTFLNTLANDLNMSGWFNVAMDGKGVIVVAGTCADNGSTVSVACNVKNSDNGTKYLDQSYSEQSAGARRLAHKVADDIVWAVRKVKGIASTRIAMVGTMNGRKDIYICDADGGGMMQMTKDGVVCVAPKWSPDGEKLVYTSYKSGFPDLYIIDMKTYARQKVSDQPGLNTGGAIGPDGRSMALILSRDGNPEIYMMNLASRKLTRVTRTANVAEASPSWSPDGGQLVYVSNAAGLPHLYVSGLNGAGKRITFRGNENVAPDWGPGGIAYCSRREGRYQVCVYDPEKGQDKQQVTFDGVDSEDPSWAPDARHIVCSRTAAYHSDLYVLDTMGDAPVRLTRIQGEWYSPAWSPK